MQSNPTPADHLAQGPNASQGALHVLLKDSFGPGRTLQSNDLYTRTFDHVLLRRVKRLGCLQKVLRWRPNILSKGGYAELRVVSTLTFFYSH